MTEQVSEQTPAERPCTRCGACLAVCPQALSPIELHFAIRAFDWPGLATLRLDACTECAACEPVCPSAIALVADFRFARSDRAWWEAERQRADAARTRYQARQQRLAAQESERQRRLLPVSRPTTDTTPSARSLLAAALARSHDKQKRPS